MRTIGFFAGIFCMLLSTTLQAQPFRCAGTDLPRAAAKIAGRQPQIPAHGHVNVLVVFAQFADESLTAVPGYAAELFDADRPGSFTHFYHTMSFGQLQVHGTVLPRRYRSDEPAAAYLSQEPGQPGDYGVFVKEILRKVDADIDLGCFDNDGPDGIANSGDDDGRVDYVFVNLRSVPENFILGRATGKASLGFRTYRSATDTSASGKPLRIEGMGYYGTLLQEGSFSQTVGSMAHEFGHGLGLPDLYDTSFLITPDQDPAEDGAGVGAWCLMGWGAHGWKGDDGPNPLCAWSREQLGWIGSDNERLVEVRADGAELTVADVQREGLAYKVPLPDGEYLLLEQRDASFYYNHSQPAAGLLIWHIRPEAGDNSQEENKLVELVCADGRDALDAWAHDLAYCAMHGGNLGDETDLFDGVRFTHLERGGLAFEIDRQGRAMQVAVSPVGSATTGAGEPTAVLADLASPAAFQLLPNYPNPFNPQTTLRYQLPEAGQVRVKVYNALGQAVRTLVHGPQLAGVQQVVWNGRDEQGQEMAGGVYHYRLEAGDRVQTRQMLLVR